MGIMTIALAQSMKETVDPMEYFWLQEAKRIEDQTLQHPVSGSLPDWVDTIERIRHGYAGDRFDETMDA